MSSIISLSERVILAAADHSPPTAEFGLAFPGWIVLAVAVGFLLYVFTGSSRLVAGVLFVGLLLLVGAGFIRMMDGRSGPRGPLVGLAPERRPGHSEEMGLPATTSLLGAQSRGHSFVYVVGGSPAMAEGGLRAPLRAVKEPLRRSITDLQRNHVFQVFVNLGTGPGLAPEPGNDALVAADNHNVAQALNWIDALDADALNSHGPPDRRRPFVLRDELYRALALQPDVIYFVTDGKEPAPSPKERQSLARFNTGQTALHVIQLTTDGKGQQPPQWLPDLARQLRGTFRQVALAPLTPEKDPSKQSPRPEVVAEAAPGKRPDWVADPPQPLERTGNGTYRAVVSSGPSKGEDRCRDNFDRNLLAMTAGYIDQVIQRGAGREVTQAPELRERVLQYLSTNVIKERYREAENEDPVIRETISQYALLEFKPEAVEFFNREWRSLLQRQRVLLFGGAVVILLALVATVFGYLKTDTATRGYYTGRLRLAAGVLIIGLMSAAVALFMHGNW